MALSDVALCSRALLKIGAYPITSFSDDLIEAEIATALYQPTRDALLSAYPWRFATTQVELVPLVDAQLADFLYAYQLPADFLRSLSAGANGRSDGLIFRIVKNTLQTDSDNVILNYVFRPDEDDTPAFFDNLLMAQLAAEFCLPLTENTSRADTLYRLANQIFAQAKKIDANQDTPKALLDFNLIDARNS